MKIEGYGALQAVHDGARTIILRARRLSDDRPVVLKQIRTPFPSEAEIARLRREHDLARAAAGPGVVAMYGLHAGQGTAWLEMEECRGASLEALLARGAIAPLEALEIARWVVDALDHVHRAGVVHKDVGPGNVVVDLEARSATLIDFGLASATGADVPAGGDRLEGTPAYMSPEQTGRVHRALDRRSDYYSLGATLYHLLVGEPPFAGADPIETAYLHITQEAVPPRARRPEVPEAVSDVVMTLLAKRADERYQSAAGLRHDLDACLDAMQSGHVLAGFAPRREDRVEALRIPDTLYGRAAEIEALLAAVERVARGGSEACFVTGAAGAGKTALIGEAHRGAAAHRALLVSAKFEQLQRDVPYSAVLHALRQLIHRILGLDAAQLGVWRARLRDALGEGSGVLVESLPELELLLWKQPPVPQVSALEAERRLRDALVRLVGALPGAASPAVLFLDDLQWADTASVALLERLLVETGDADDPAGLRRVLLLGTWRSEEVDEAHPLSRAVARASRLGARTAKIELAPLSVTDARALLADTLVRPAEEVAPLAQLAHAWTGGNPFLLRGVVDRLSDEGLLRRDGARWTWDVEEIAARGLPADAAGFVAGRIAELPADARRALDVASCVGTRFAVSVLCEALGRPRDEVSASLAPAVALKLIRPLDPAWFADLDLGFAFAHDRVLESAHARMGDGDAAGIHLRVGRLLQRRGDVDVFEVVHHLNLAVARLSAEERAALLRLDADAGRRALRSGAFAPASALLEQALALLPPGAWEADEDTTRALVLDAARAASLAGASDRMDAHLDAALAHARAPLHRAAALEIRALDRAGRDILEAIDVALLAMEELGVALPRRPEMKDVEAAMGAAMTALAAVGPDGVVALPDLDDPVAALVIRLAGSVMAPAYLAVPLLLPLLAAETVKQTLAHGVTPPATYGYAVLALVLTAGEAFAAGQQTAELCVRLMERFHGRGHDARPGHVVFGHVLPFSLPLREAVAAHRPFQARALTAGDHEYATWVAHLSLANAFYAGAALDGLSAELEREAIAMRRLGQQAPLDCTDPFRRHVRALRGQTPRPDRMDEDGYTEAGAHAALVASGSRGAVYVLGTQRLALRFVLRDLAGALEAADAAEPFADGAAVTYHQIVFRQTLALVCIALAEAAGGGGARAELLARARANRALLDAPAAHAPHNHRHRLLLVDAELARAEGDSLAAIDGYDAAIAAARANGFVHEEALADELAGRFHLARGRITPARAYLLEGASAWARWGASAKLRQLEEELPELTARFDPGGARGAKVDATQAELDLATLSRATLAITSELRTHSLGERVLAVAMQDAGATRAMLLVERAGALRLLAAHGEGLSPRGTPLAELSGVPVSVLQYAARTGARLVLPDARSDPRFASDPRLRADRPLSVLAFPLVLRGRATGLLYLENDLAGGALRAERTQLQEMLCAQAAISLENARLYEEADALTQRLQAKVRDRSRELQWALDRLGAGAAEESALPPGTVLSEHVKIIRRLGEGGMGAVYLAEDLRTRERVAVKVVLGSTARDVSSVKRFLRESRAAATVSHPAVARTLWVDVSEQGFVFQVQELVDGEPLSRVLWSQRRLSPAEAARLGAILAAGLAEAHAAGVVHRDLKPSNVMVAAADPGLKLLDFGIARLIAEHGAPGVTRAGHLVGTPDYMAPEQLLTPDRVHPSIDVYAFGRMLFRAITGRLPDHATPRSVRAPFAPSPAVSFEPSVPAELAELLTACMAAEPDERPDAATIAKALSTLADRVEAPPLTALASRWVVAVRDETPRTPADHDPLTLTTATMAPPEEGE